jgi:hypothetical protein
MLAAKRKIRGSRPSVRRNGRTTKEDTADYLSPEHYVTNLSMSDSSVSIDGYSQISQKSRENDDLKRSYETLDQKTVVVAVPQETVVYDRLAVVAEAAST